MGQFLFLKVKFQRKNIWLARLGTFRSPVSQWVCRPWARPHCSVGTRSLWVSLRRSLQFHFALGTSNYVSNPVPQVQSVSSSGSKICSGTQRPFFLNELSGELWGLVFPRGQGSWRMWLVLQPRAAGWGKTLPLPVSVNFSEQHVWDSWTRACVWGGRPYRVAEPAFLPLRFIKRGLCKTFT